MKRLSTPNNSSVYRLLGGRCNVYGVVTGKKGLIVDTSIPLYRRALLRVVEKHTAEDCHFQTLVLTHAHFDHAGNATALLEHYPMEVFIHKSEAPYLSRGISSEIQSSHSGINRILTSLRHPLESRHRYAPVRRHTLVQNHVSLQNQDMDAYILHTPGHTPGSISIIVDNHIALVGDAMVAMLPYTIFPPFVADAKQLMGSWKRLLDTGCSLFLPSHGAPIRRQTLVQQYLKLCPIYS